MTQIGSILNGVLKRTADWKMRVISEWPTIMGPLASRISVEKIEGDAIFVRVCNSTWMQELYLLSDLLLNKINQTLPQPYIKKIRFKHAIPLTIKTTSTTHTITHKTRARPQLNQQEKRALNAIVDTDLRTALEQFLTRCYYTRQS